jgi:uncharacterized membrane protein
MIPKSGNRFSEKIMFKQKDRARDSIGTNSVQGSGGAARKVVPPGVPAQTRFRQAARHAAASPGRPLRIPRFDHFRHHGRFYLSVVCGIAVWLLPIRAIDGIRIPLSGATFFLVYLASSAALARSLTTEDLRKKARFEDEGIVVIVLITLAVIGLSIGSLVLLLGSDERNGWLLVPAVANVPLSWATLHTILAFHYAHLFYSPSEGSGAKAHDTGGLEFPKTKEPSVSDFVYFSFVVGMTAQTSDVDVTGREMRNTTIAHAVVSFFFNTVILALAVNVVTRG